MERLELFGWVVEADAAQTADYYTRHPQCQCASCRNLVATMEQWPSVIPEALRLMGADPSKEGEIMEFGQDEDGLHLYHIGCPIVGRIISEPPTALKPSWHSGTYKFSFSANRYEYPVHRDFPDPRIFASLEARLPWVLDEPEHSMNPVTARPTDRPTSWTSMLSWFLKRRP